MHLDNGQQQATYIGYIDVHGNVKATQHDFLSGTTNEVLIRSWFQPDDHNNPTFLVLPDQRIMIFYSRHTDESAFYYRIFGSKMNTHNQKSCRNGIGGKVAYFQLVNCPM